MTDAEILEQLKGMSVPKASGTIPVAPLGGYAAGAQFEDLNFGIVAKLG